ncbi:hypothetical protein [Aporhodopirellula aestuarii]|uniref:Response regulatory domain-containing protein n=1 Tax=Aporhodopirellula aestuarii TaxID=2950107 RepID=A0ABT0U4C4_9BACT|nr:hypothetical protein [Aporhodopirellula aestuarii]MCM2371288.1 hypothetical protein [Aporhodopirellula aestuarii]
MKTSRSNSPPFALLRSQQAAAGDEQAFGCDRLLWVGDNEHRQMRPAWRICQKHCDTIAVRYGIDEALESPPRQMPTHVIVAQTNRHERTRLAIDGVGYARFRSLYPEAEVLVVRGPLVASTVRLPESPSPLASLTKPRIAASPADARSCETPIWVDSVSSDEAPTFLPHWLTSQKQAESGDVRLATGESSAIENDSDQLHEPTQPIVGPIAIVASRFADAESYLDALAGLLHDSGRLEPMIRWQRELTHRTSSGFATVLWDESAAPATTPEDWRERCERAPEARHVWMTGLANLEQRTVARENGIHNVLEKPGRLECLIASLAF